MTSILLLLVATAAVQGAVIKGPTKQLRKIPPWDTIIGNVKDLGPSYEVNDLYQKQDANDISVDTTSGETSIEDDKLAEEVDKHAEELDKHADEVDKHADEVDKHADEVDKQADELDKQADELDKQADELDKQAEELDKHADELDKLADEMDELADKMDELADKMDEKQDCDNGDDDSNGCDCRGVNRKKACDCDDDDVHCVCGSSCTEQACDCDHGDNRKNCKCGSDGTKQACDCDDGDNTAHNCRCNNGETDCNQTDEKHKKKASQNDKKKGGYPQCKLDYLPPKTKSRCCGTDGVTKAYIHGGNETQLGQYPWLVYLEYYDSERRESFYECGGSLISGRYVLTAAHCYTDLNLNPAVAVHVGDHYVYHPGPDCTNGGCNDGDKRILIESFVKYPEYEKGRSEYDIALIRMQEPVSFTDFVRPICLPSFDIYKDIDKKPTLYVAGWGGTEKMFMLNNINNEKRAVSLPIRDVEECHWIKSKQTIICAGGDKGKDSCVGDSGGPLMMAEDGQFYLVGVVASGPNDCGNGMPAVYTHVYKYVRWIYEQIEA